MATRFVSSQLGQNGSLFTGAAHKSRYELAIHLALTHRRCLFIETDRRNIELWTEAVKGTPNILQLLPLDGPHPNYGKLGMRH